MKCVASLVLDTWEENREMLLIHQRTHTAISGIPWLCKKVHRIWRRVRDIELLSQLLTGQEDSPLREEFEDKDHWYSQKGDMVDPFWKFPQ